MSKPQEKIIEVFANWIGLPGPTLVGYMHATPARGNEVFSFEYHKNWLENPRSQALDPSLQMLQGRQYAPDNQDNFGVFLDSSPDRWGRFLMKRHEAQLAREEHRKERKLLESDYLLGVYDEQRMGALRFRLESENVFLDNNKERASPPWASLRELEHASLELEKKDAEHRPGYTKWLRMLIAPGGSLGGARPKAGVIDKKTHLWIAKFPSDNDSHNVGAWELLVNNLAKRAGINIADSHIEKFNHRYHTFLSKRFDRTDKNERIHFVSAMTLLQRTDGDDASNGVSYLELAALLSQQGAQPESDLEQLWRRIVFYICTSNVDDHLRNHGFLLTHNGWILSPAFDINPVADGHGLKLNISETDNSLDLSLAKEVAEYFRIKPDRANAIIKEITNEVKKWRKEATSLGISVSEQDFMEPAFRVAEAVK